MADVVGTAYVNVRALTDSLGKDIKKNFEKSYKDANLEKLASAKGEDIGESMGEGIADGTKKTLTKKAKSGDVFPDAEDLFAGVRKDIRRAGDELAKDLDWGDRIRRSVDLHSDDIRKSLKKVSEFGSIDTDFSLPFADSRKLTEKFKDSIKSLRGSVKDTANDFKTSFNNIRTHTSGTFDKIRGNIKESIGDFKKWRQRAEVDGGGIGNVIDTLASKLQNFGGGGKGGLGKLGGRAGIYGAIAAALVAVLPIIQDVGSAILAYATGLVAQIGFIVTALGGLGVAAGAALGSVLVSIGPIALAFASQTKALEEFKDSMKTVGEEFLLIGTATQATLLPALEGAAEKLIDLVPLFSEFGLFVGHIVGNFATLAAETLTGNKAQERFGDILRSSLNILDILLPTLINIGDILSGIWVAAIPAAERFVQSLSDMVQRWTDLVNVGLDDGTLTRTFDLWYDRAQTLGSALGNLTGALFDILQVGANSADNVFDRFDEWARGYREFTESEAGQNRLKLIFDNSLAVMREINGIAADLFDGIFGRLSDVGGVDGTVEALQRFRDILPDIQEKFQDFLGTVEGLTSAIGPKVIDKVKETFEELKEPIGRLAFQILDLFEAMEESGAFETLLDLLKILADVLRTILSIPGFGTFIGYLIAFGTAAKVASFALGPLVGVLGPFLSIVRGLAVARVGGELVGIASGLGKIGAQTAAKKALGDSATGLSTLVASTAARGGGGIGGILSTIGTSLGVMGPVGIAAGVAVAGLGYAFYKHKKDAAEFKQEVRQATDALGLLNGGLNIAAEGVEKYILESSRFDTRNQIDDLARLGLTTKQLAEDVADGTNGSIEFANRTLAAKEVYASFTDTVDANNSVIKETATSVEQLGKKYSLTHDQQKKLAETGELIFGDGDTLRLSLEGNDDLIDSYRELFKVIGKGAKDRFAAFATNDQNVRLLGRRVLDDVAKALEDEDDPAEQVRIMTDVMAKLEDEAKAQLPTYDNLSQATRDLAREQSLQADGTLDLIKYEGILNNERKKLLNSTRDNLNLFFSADFQDEFSAVKAEVVSFSNFFEDIDFEQFQFVGNFGGLDDLLEAFPRVEHAAGGLFDALRGLPKDEFNAAAAALNLDADSLRENMNAAQQAIITLQETALSKLPSIQDVLENSLKTDADGEQVFDPKGFEKGANERVAQTEAFSDHIANITKTLGTEQGLLALQQGPKAAEALSRTIAAHPEQTKELITKMETAESEFKKKIDDLFGDKIAAQYLAKTKPAGDAMAIGLTGSLTEPSTFKALEDGGTALLNSMEHGFKGKFEIKDDLLTFTPLGRFTRKTINTQLNRIPRSGSGGLQFSTGGFVPGFGAFNTGPKGTDTVPAWLTPGEFVLRRSIAQAIPADVLKGLNSGDPRLLSMLSARGVGTATAQSANGSFGTSAPQGSVFGQGSVVIYAQGTSATEVYREFDSRTNWKLTSRGDR